MNITSAENWVLYSEFRNDRNTLGYDSARQNKKSSIGNEFGNALFFPPFKANNLSNKVGLQTAAILML